MDLSNHLHELSQELAEFISQPEQSVNFSGSPLGTLTVVIDLDVLAKFQTGSEIKRVPV